ncbi:hypothetical protein ACAI80_004286 [Salmonella enterica]
MKKEIIVIDGTECYVSKPCKKCNTTIRYLSTRHCVHCKKQENAKADARAYRNSKRERVADGSMRQHLANYFRRGGTKRGAPTTALEWEMLRQEIMYNREIIRVMKKVHGENMDFGHKYPVNPDENDPYAIYSSDGVLFIGRHVASNIKLESSSYNRSKGNNIKPGYYSASQLTPLVHGEFIKPDGSKMSVSEMLESYENDFPFPKSGYLTAEEKAERQKRMLERKEKGLASIDYKYTPLYREKVYSKPDWTMLKSTLNSMLNKHKLYGELEHGEGLRVSIANDLVADVERAIDIDSLGVKYSGDIEKALDYCWLIISDKLDGCEIEPLYLPVVDQLINKQCWYGVDIAIDGTACRVHYNAEEEPTLSEVIDFNEEIDKADEYYNRFKSPLPRRKYESMWTHLLLSNPDWELIKEDWDMAGCIFWMMGKQLKYDTLENMKSQNDLFAARGIRVVSEDCCDDRNYNNYLKLTKNAKNYVDVLGHPTSEYRAWLQGWYADELDKLNGDNSIEANNIRFKLLFKLREEVLNNQPYI